LLPGAILLTVLGAFPAAIAAFAMMPGTRRRYRA